MNRKLLTYLLLIILVPIAGEFNFYPLKTEIRISLGTPVFFFILLWSNRINPIVAGFLTGLSVVIFRVQLGTTIMVDSSIASLWGFHGPVFFYYFTYGLFFYLLRLKKFLHAPFIMGLLGVVTEVSASMLEIGARNLIFQQEMSFSTFMWIKSIAILRSFFVLGFFNIIILRKTKQGEAELRAKNEQMLILVSNLYVEMIQLTKTIQNAENLTRESYELYIELKKENHRFATNLLSISGKTHEIKKDDQRIFSGLAKLIDKGPNLDYMNIEEILNVIVASNHNYSLFLEKKIRFRLSINGSHPPYRTYVILSIINNLVANAVEAIEGSGEVVISVNLNEDFLIISVSDNGPGIAKKHRKLIFQPGFTTKFEGNGKPSNGIGLTYIKNVIEEIEGTIELVDQEKDSGTTFVISLPINKMKGSDFR
ncbi:sensor histidine kinase [Robertmurraya siralis]|uniref:sensor histidine kinase n=1 Tax=Robertmurraya siralis TaxID=77777 RepID=UPI000BA675FD|nr:sensor histidine kinase [Robertmurraya siralis]PAE22146.1 hypothetical protein CHH80_02935 [Bacillus sp. 7504-2]